MPLYSNNKLNQLNTSVPSGIVLTSSDLDEMGISYALRHYYLENNWLDSVGYGAYKRAGDNIDIFGAVHALQSSTCMAHIGAITAFQLFTRGYASHKPFKRSILFLAPKTRVPQWFKDYEWNTEWEAYAPNLFTEDSGIVKFTIKDFDIQISNPTRSILESAFLAKDSQDLEECLDCMTRLTNPKPQRIQHLLSVCTSPKAKRLFLFMAEKCNHKWVDDLDVSRIDLGKGKRQIIKNGRLAPKYGITIPKNW